MKRLKERIFKCNATSFVCKLVYKSSCWKHHILYALRIKQQCNTPWLRQLLCAYYLMQYLKYSSHLMNHLVNASDWMQCISTQAWYLAMVWVWLMFGTLYLCWWSVSTCVLRCDAGREPKSHSLQVNLLNLSLNRLNLSAQCPASGAPLLVSSEHCALSRKMIWYTSTAAKLALRTCKAEFKTKSLKNKKTNWHIDPWSIQPLIVKS